MGRIVVHFPACLLSPPSHLLHSKCPNNYPQYKNMRADYLTSIWSVVNFADVSRRLEKALL